jgi:hypothetical protein
MSGTSSPVSTTWRRSGAFAAAVDTAVVNCALPSSTRARESITSLVSSPPVSIDEHGTATAPRYIVARMAVASSMSSDMHISTRSSGRTPSAASPPATSRTSAVSSA